MRSASTLLPMFSGLRERSDCCSSTACSCSAFLSTASLTWAALRRSSSLSRYMQATFSDVTVLSLPYCCRSIRAVQLQLSWWTRSWERFARRGLRVFAFAAKPWIMASAIALSLIHDVRWGSGSSVRAGARSSGEWTSMLVMMPVRSLSQARLSEIRARFLPSPPAEFPFDERRTSIGSVGTSTPPRMTSGRTMVRAGLAFRASAGVSVATAGTSGGPATAPAAAFPQREVMVAWVACLALGFIAASFRIFATGRSSSSSSLSLSSSHWGWRSSSSIQSLMVDGRVCGGLGSWQQCGFLPAVA